jgi:hypothetical protein
MDMRKITSPINGRKGGRPIKRERIHAEAMKRRFIQRVYAKVDKYLDAWEDVALGHYVEVKLPTGGTRVYQKSPSGLVLKDIFEHVWGKPKQTLEIEADVKTHLTIEALRRMAPYVDSNDEEFKLIEAEAIASPKPSRYFDPDGNILWERFIVREVGNAPV